MNRYDPDIEQEFVVAMKRVAARAAEQQLNDVETLVRQWKKKTLKTGEALSAIRRTVSAPLILPGAKEDPGTSLAMAASQGLVSDKDMSKEAWRTVEVLMTVMEL